jgi:hypothetical protein
VLVWVFPRRPGRRKRLYTVVRTAVRASVQDQRWRGHLGKVTVDRSFVELLATHYRRLHDRVLILIDDLDENQLFWRAAPTSRNYSPGHDVVLVS